MLKYSDFLLKPLKSHRFKIAKDIHYLGIKVPKGYTSDGASIPRFLWCLIPPNRTDYLPCAIIHDYLCDIEDYKKADIYFYRCMMDLKVNRYLTYLMYCSIRLYHKIRYRK